VVYDLGRDTARVEEENWVIRWMLWHVFRYRDSRNKNRRPTSPCEDRSRYSNMPSISSIASRGAVHSPCESFFSLLANGHYCIKYWFGMALCFHPKQAPAVLTIMRY
jgi:hypothetical protein